jgi:hypothetical protein
LHTTTTSESCIGCEVLIDIPYIKAKLSLQQAATANKVLKRSCGITGIIGLWKSLPVTTNLGYLSPFFFVFMPYNNSKYKEILRGFREAPVAFH